MSHVIFCKFHIVIQVQTCLPSRNFRICPGKKKKRDRVPENTEVQFLSRKITYRCFYFAEIFVSFDAVRLFNLRNSFLNLRDVRVATSALFSFSQSNRKRDSRRIALYRIRSALCGFFILSQFKSKRDSKLIALCRSSLCGFCILSLSSIENVTRS